MGQAHGTSSSTSQQAYKCDQGRKRSWPVDQPGGGMRSFGGRMVGAGAPRPAPFGHSDGANAEAGSRVAEGFDTAGEPKIELTPWPASTCARAIPVQLDPWRAASGLTVKRPDLTTRLQDLRVDPEPIGAFRLGDVSQLGQVRFRSIALPHGARVIRHLRAHLELTGLRLIAVSVDGVPFEPSASREARATLAKIHRRPRAPQSQLCSGRRASDSAPETDRAMSRTSTYTSSVTSCAVIDTDG